MSKVPTTQSPAMDQIEEIDGSRRAVLGAGTAILGMLGLSSCSTLAKGQSSAQTAGVVSPLAGASFPSDFPGEGQIPWIRRIFHSYTGPDGLSRVDQLAVEAPEVVQFATLLRRTAYRITVSGSAPGAGFDFHVANHPTFLIPLFGSMIIGLDGGEEYELRHGDLAYAEDCTGKGHISRSGPEGSFMISVQLPQEGCPSVGRTDMQSIWSE